MTPTHKLSRVKGAVSKDKVWRKAKKLIKRFYQEELARR